MPNISKSFNFRNGVQVDNDNFVVSSLGLVGIGTSVPTELLDVIGTARIVGVVTTNDIYTENITITDNVSAINIEVGVTSIGSGFITATSTSGIVTYFGDGANLLNLPTSQWEDVNVGLGFTSIYNRGYVGIATIDPRFYLQIGGNNVPLFEGGVGISSTGDVWATGIVTSGYFVGDGSGITNLTAENIETGYIDNDRIPENINVTGVITASSFYGNLVGVADTSDSITSTSTINIAGSIVGTSTVTNNLYVTTAVGIGTSSTTSSLHIQKTGAAVLQVTSSSAESIVALGRNPNTNVDNAQFKFGNTSGSYPYSTSQSLDIINLDNGNFNSYIFGNSNFNWIYGTAQPRMTLTYDGKLGLNQQIPDNTLHVSGTSTVTSNAWFGGDVTILGSNNITGNLNSTNGIFNDYVIVSGSSINPTYKLQVGGDPLLADGVGISSTGNLDISDSMGIGVDLTVTRNASVSGIFTATTIYGNGSNIQNLTAGNLNGQINNINLPSDINISGILTANIINATSYGDISASSITASSITASSSVSSASTITASEGFSTGSGNLLALGTGRIEITISGSNIVFTDSDSGQSASLPLS